MKAIYLFIALVFIISCKSSSSSDSDTTPETNATLDLVAEMEQNEQVTPGVEETIEEIEKEGELVSSSAMDYNFFMDPDFLTGQWEGTGIEGFDFSFWIYVEDGFVSGQYCAINDTASRIDCGEQDEVGECYIKGPLNMDGDTIQIEVISCYSRKAGKAILYPEGDNMIWEILEEPGEAGKDYFAPMKSEMVKTSIEVF
jgi:hypothetical protein